MEEGLGSRPESGKGDHVSAYPADFKDPLGNSAIAVRTEINVTQDAASLKSAR